MSRITLALLVLSACATAAPARRTLMTDEVHLGTSRDTANAWYRDHGWCLSDDVFRRCSGGSSDPAEIQLQFDDAGVLVLMEVRYATDPGGPMMDQPTARNGSSAHQRTSSSTVDSLPGDRATRRLDELANELATRYGEPENVTEKGRLWRVPGHQIELFISDSRLFVIERHRR